MIGVPRNRLLGLQPARPAVAARDSSEPPERAFVGPVLAALDALEVGAHRVRRATTDRRSGRRSGSSRRCADTTRIIALCAVQPPSVPARGYSTPSTAWPSTVCAILRIALLPAPRRRSGGRRSPTGSRCSRSRGHGTRARRSRRAGCSCPASAACRRSSVRGSPPASSSSTWKPASASRAATVPPPAPEPTTM